MDWPLVAEVNTELPYASLESALVPPPKADTLRGQAPPPEPLYADRDRQEHQLIQDALQLLAGCEGEHVQFSESFDPYFFDDRIRGPDYRFHRAIDSGARNILIRIAEIARFQFAVRAFVDRYVSRDYGRVNNALSAALRVLTSDFVVQVAKIETATQTDADFSLYKLWLHIHTFQEPLSDAYTVVSALQDESRTRRSLKVNEESDIRAQQQFEDRAVRQEEELVVHDDNEAIIDLRGGSILRVLAELIHKRGGNAQSRKLLKQLLKAASRPYIEMLGSWIYNGNLDDPWQDFLVRETKPNPKYRQTDAAVDTFWDLRYELRKLELPLQFQDSGITNKLVTTGKFLNVLRECGVTDLQEPSHDILAEADDIEDHRVIVAINAAYDVANARLLELLKSRFGLRQRLVSFNHYFFLDNGDFFPILLEMALPELMQPAHSSLAPRLQTLLEVALSHPNSASKHEPFVDECQVKLSELSLWDELLDVEINETTKSTPNLLAIQAMKLDFTIEFPLSLILSRNAIMRYQFLFRLIAEIKWTDKLLQNAWLEQTQVAQWVNPWKAGGRSMEEFRCGARELRSRMALCVAGLLYHTTVTVVQANWREFDKTLEKADDVQQIGRDHATFVQRCLSGCFLTYPAMLHTQAQLLAVCRDFSVFVKESSTSIAWIDPATVPEQDRDLLDPVLTPDQEAYTPGDLMAWLEESLDEFQTRFEDAVLQFLDQLNRQLLDDGLRTDANLILLQMQLSSLLKPSKRPAY